MELQEVLHEIVAHLPIHDKVKAELHDKVDSAVNGDQPEQTEEA